MTTSIIVRVTTIGKPAIYMLDTMDAQAGTVQVWDGEGEPVVAPLSSFGNTRQASDVEENEWANKFWEHFKPEGGIEIRRRRWKNAPKDAPVQAPVAETPQDVRQNVGQQTPTPQITCRQGRHIGPVQQANNVPVAQFSTHDQPARQMSAEQFDKAALAERLMNNFTKVMAETLKEILK